MLRTLSRFLEFPAIYRLFNRLVGGIAIRRHFIKVYVAPRPGWRVLDVGCGTGELLEYMPEGVTYVGFDPCRRYLEAARLRHGSRGEFLHGSVEDWSPRAMGRFDAVVAFGLLHHLPDAAAALFFRKARESMAESGGKLVTQDPCFRPNLSPLARLIMQSDRGSYVRYRDDYEALAQVEFPVIHSVFDQEGLRLPYSSLVLCCREGQG